MLLKNARAIRKIYLKFSLLEYLLQSHGERNVIRWTTVAQLAAVGYVSFIHAGSIILLLLETISD